MDRLNEETMAAVQCAYLPEQTRQIGISRARVSQAEFTALIEQGWTYDMHVLVARRCPFCTACSPIRVLVDKFQPNKSQRRAERANADTILSVTRPTLPGRRKELVELYMAHHSHHHAQKGWPAPTWQGAQNSVDAFCSSPMNATEWSYRRNGKLVAVLFAVSMTNALYASYSFHDPNWRDLSLDTYMVLNLIRVAAEHKLPYVYLGTFVSDCRSLAYKQNFTPNQILGPDGVWRDHQTG